MDSLDMELEVKTRTGQPIIIRLHSRIFEIPGADFRVSYVDGETVSTCPIRMRVSLHDNVLITIGRILLRSVDALRFNYDPVRPRITIVPRFETSGNIAPFLDPVSRIPMFGNPIVVSENGNKHIKIPNRGNKGYLILWSRIPEKSNHERTECWYLFRRYPRLLLRDRETLPTSWVVDKDSTRTVIWSEDSDTRNIDLELSAVGVTRLKITLHYSFFRVSVCSERLSEPSILDLPLPRRVDEPEADECSICLGSFELNSEVQSMNNCDHKFHPACIRHWLSINELCPICRQSFRVKPTPPVPAPPSTHSTNFCCIVS